MKGKTLFSGLAIFAVIFGIALYYFQTRAWYDVTEVEVSDAVLDWPVENYTMIDAKTSPIKYRGCFTGAPYQAFIERYQDVGEATPLIAPRWFDCFDAKALTDDIESGAVAARRVRANEIYGTDEYVAVYPDGRGVVWRQLNECGKEYFNDKPVPATCPEPPQQGN